MTTAIGGGKAAAIEPGPDDLEIWQPIPGWPGYEVSDWGRVHSYWGAGGRSRGQRGIGLTPKIIGGHVMLSGHRSVLLYRNQSREKWRPGVHILVLEAFVGPRPRGMEACHNDGNPGNNRLANLRWDTRPNNQIDISRHGRRKSQRLTEEDIPGIWARLVAGEGDTTIAADYRVGTGVIRAVRNGAAWAHLTRNLPGAPPRSAIQAAEGEPIYVPDEYTGSEVELWKPIEGWPGYRVSNFGRVATFRERIAGGKRGEHRISDTPRIMTPRPQPSGHLLLRLCNDGLKARFLVHRLVLSAFAGPCPSGFVACHNDGDPSNNHADNLRWDTQKRNILDRVRHRGR